MKSMSVVGQERNLGLGSDIVVIKGVREWILINSRIKISASLSDYNLANSEREKE